MVDKNNPFFSRGNGRDICRGGDTPLLSPRWPHINWLFFWPQGFFRDLVIDSLIPKQVVPVKFSRSAAVMPPRRRRSYPWQNSQQVHPPRTIPPEVVHEEHRIPHNPGHLYAAYFPHPTTGGGNTATRRRQHIQEGATRGHEGATHP